MARHRNNEFGASDFGLMVGFERFVLVICSERSGSNLLRLILNQHPAIYIGPVTLLFETFRPILSSYGDLSDDARWKELLEDVVRLYLANHTPIPCQITTQELEQHMARPSRSLGSILRAVYGMLAEKNEADIPGFMIGTNLEYLPTLLEIGNFSHVLYQVRDPRDVVLSQIKAGYQEAKAVEIAKYWMSQQHEVLNALSNIAQPILQMRYEDLLRQPDVTINKVWDFLDVEPTDESLEFHRSDTARQLASMLKLCENLSNPLMPDNSEKYFDKWSWWGTKRIEWVARQELKRFGYAPSSPIWKYKRWFGEPKPLEVSEAEKSVFIPVREVWRELMDKAASRSS